VPKPTFWNLPEAKRTRITDLAIAEFARWPYPQASLSRIVQQAGIAKGSMYQYFADKFDLYHWLVAEVLPSRKAASMTGLPPTEGFFESLHSALHQGLTMFRTDPLIARLGVRVLEPVEDVHATALHAAMIGTSYDTAKAMLAQGQALGIVRRDLDPATAAHLWIAMIGTGIWAALAACVPGGIAALNERPEALSSLTDDELIRVAETAIAMLRGAVEATVPLEVQP
jgi:AcrR family transcriptional regulator